MNNLKRVKDKIDTFPKLSLQGFHENSLHDQIDAMNAICKMNKKELYLILHYAYDLSYSDHSTREEEVELLIKDDYDAKRVFVWALDNVYAREVLRLLSIKQNAENELTNVRL